MSISQIYLQVPGAEEALCEERGTLRASSWRRDESAGIASLVRNARKRISLSRFPGQERNSSQPLRVLVLFFLKDDHLNE